MTAQKIAAQLALVADDYTLVINRGARSGARTGMTFAVYSGAGRMVVDPQSGRELGRLSPETLRVKIVEVRPLFAVAQTFATHGEFERPHTSHDWVTVNVGDTVELVDAAGCDDRFAARRSASAPR